VRTAQVGRFVKLKRIYCSAREHPDVKDYLEKHGVVVRTDDTPAIPHAISHACRDVAVRNVIGGQLHDLNEARILSVYGAIRDKRWEVDHYKNYFKDGDVHQVTLDGKLTVELCPDETYPGDAGKDPRVRIKPTGLYNLVIAVDVYWNGIHGRIDKAFLDDWTSYSTKKEMFFITRDYRGAGGADVEETGVPGEGVWFKDAKGLISFSPDSSNYGYPLHYAIDALDHKVYQGYSITFLERVGPYVVHKVAKDAPWTIQVECKLQADGGTFQRCTVDHYGSTRWLNINRYLGPTLWRWLGWSSDCLYFTKAAIALKTPVQGRAASAHVRSTAANQVLTICRQSATFNEFESRYPGIAQDVVEGTRTVVLYDGLREAAFEAADLRLGHAEAENDFVTAHAPAAPVMTRWRAASMKALVVTLMVLFMLGRLPGAFGQELAVVSEDVTVDPAFWMVLAVPVSIVLWALLYVLCKRRSTERLFHAWIETRVSGEEWLGDERRVVELSEDDIIPATVSTWYLAEPLIPRRGQLECTVDGVICTPTEACVALELYIPRTTGDRMYPILATSGMGHRPMNHPINTLTAVVVRNHGPILGERDDVVLMGRWMDCAKRTSGMIHLACGDPYTEEECAKALAGAKANLFRIEASRLHLGSAYFGATECKVKHNETLALKETSDGSMKLKPRTIVVLPQVQHVILAPYARAFSDLCHNVFDGRMTTIGVQIVYAAGSTGRQLNQLFEMLASGIDTLAVSGDDIIAYYSPDHTKATQGVRENFWEEDFVACDQSERMHAIAHHARIMSDAGIPKLVIDGYITACCGKYKISHGPLSVVGNSDPELATGVDFTTVVNSLTAIAVECRRIVLRKTVEDNAYELGVKIKVKRFCGLVGGPTFLKGWCLRNAQDFLCWYPLPSQVLKLGKQMEDPARFSASRDRSEGVYVVAYALSQSMKTVPRDYPILGPYLAALERVGRCTEKVVKSSEDGWYKPSVDAGSVDRALALSAICDRYDTTVADIVELETLFDNVHSLPVLVMHPLLVQMQRVDYG
jgi:hypothetical protein